MHGTALDGVAKRAYKRGQIKNSDELNLVTHSFDFIFMALLGIYLTYRSLFICNK